MVIYTIILKICWIFELMKKHILPFKWEEGPQTTRINSAGNEIILIDQPVVLSVLDYPLKVVVTMAIFCFKGNTKMTINLKPYETEEPCLIILLPGQILECKHVSSDFSALFIIMSHRFTENLQIEERFPAFLSIQKNPYVKLNNSEMEAFVDYCRMMKNTVENNKNPYYLQIAKYLTKAFFYGFGYNIHIQQENQVVKKPKQHILVEKFLQLLQKYYTRHRSINFYATNLSLTPKYLSKVIKENSGLSASEWIDNHVILEAKALLKSTDMTIQQISDKLNFPSQSFFGKYFKRLENMSPSEYRKGGLTP